MDKVPKKRAPAKIKARKTSTDDTRVVLAVKKVAKRKLTERIAPTKASVKSKPGIKVARKLPIKKVVSKSNNNPDEVKFIPGTISLRLAEKRKLYARVYQDYVPKVMRPVAIVGGYAYITVGIFLALLMANPALSNLVSQSATALCFAGNCTSVTSTKVADIVPVKPVEFQPLAPIVSGVDTNLQLALNQDFPVRIVLLPISGGDTMSITGVSESSSNLVNFLLPTATLSNGTYLVQAELYNNETKQIRKKFIGPTLVVNNVIAEPVVSLEDTEDIVLEETSNEVFGEEQVLVGEVLGVSTTTFESEVDDLLDIESEEQLLSAVSEEEVVAELAKITPVDNTEVFALTVLPGTTLNQSVIKILPTYDFEKVELTLKQKGNGEAFFLGQATAAADAWFYWLDNTIIPNGTYNLIVRGFDNGEFKEEATFVFNNKVNQVLTEESILNEIKNRVDNSLNVKLDASQLAELRDSYATSFLNNTDNDFSADYLAGYLPKLDRLFAKYASSIAGGNDALVLLADDQLEKYVDTIIVESVEESEVDEYFSQELSAWLIGVKEYVRTQEAEIIKVTDGESALDTDQDGFTDYDEVVIYGTDPKLADTDNDGFLDSVEIVLGYGALNDKLEAVSRFTGLINTGVVNGELLAISAVDPLYFYTDENSDPKILTSVSGKGIPNSFARLYIKDMTESIIVKVGPAGTFTQTIDVDFAKVAGEVVLAVTGNTGKIILRGQPLLLAKANAGKELYNPLAIEAAIIKSTNDFKNSNTIGALGVVSFGLILLLLGKALIPRREPVTIEIA